MRTRSASLSCSSSGLQLGTAGLGGDLLGRLRSVAACSSCGAAPPLPSVSVDRLDFLCRFLCTGGIRSWQPPPPSQGWSENLFHTPLLSFSQPSPTCGGISRDKPFALLLLPLVTRPSPELARSKYARSVRGVVDGEPGVLVVLTGLDRPWGYQRLKWALRQHRLCSFALYAHVVPVEKVLFFGQQLISLTKFSCRQ